MERTPSAGRRLYLSAGTAAARAANFFLRPFASSAVSALISKMALSETAAVCADARLAPPAISPNTKIAMPIVFIRSILQNKLPHVGGASHPKWLRLQTQDWKEYLAPFKSTRKMNRTRDRRRLRRGPVYHRSLRRASGEMAY